MKMSVDDMKRLLAERLTVEEYRAVIEHYESLRLQKTQPAWMIDIGAPEVRISR